MYFTFVIILSCPAVPGPVASLGMLTRRHARRRSWGSPPAFMMRGATPFKHAPDSPRLSCYTPTASFHQKTTGSGFPGNPQVATAGWHTAVGNLSSQRVGGGSVCRGQSWERGPRRQLPTLPPGRCLPRALQPTERPLLAQPDPGTEPPERYVDRVPGDSGQGRSAPANSEKPLTTSWAEIIPSHLYSKG